MEKYLNVREIASKLDVSKMTIYRLVDAGMLPALRIGKSLRILETDLEEWITDNTTGVEEAK